METKYLPLYRKYRPQTLEQIVGQAHIKRALKNAIETDRISHAYLFTGPRGTGKTSTARIFAKSLNCVQGPTISPCNECENCKNITNSIPIDVIEIDAATNRSVNDADDIIQKVALAPVQSRYKIYIIDEVHMLSTPAFNALLKTLEEPPKNVLFILATTEIHKVPDTIKSRCQRFDFKRITTDDITAQLRYIADNEGINITQDALVFIAQNSAGGMRDSIALLDQLSVLNSTDNAITVDDINKLLGRLSFDILTALYDKIAQSDQNGALDALNSIYDNGNEPVQILQNFLEYLRNALIIKTTAADTSAPVQLNPEQIKILAQKSENIETHQIISLVNTCSQYIKELKQTSNPKLWLDVAVLDMANLVQNTKLEDLQRRISALESGEQTVQSTKMHFQAAIEQTNSAQTASQPTNETVKEMQIPVQTATEDETKPQITQESQEIEQNELQNPAENTPKPSKQGVEDFKNLWISFLEHVSSSPSRTILKQQALPVKLTPEEVIISIKSPNWLKQFAADGSKHNLIVDAAKELFGAPVSKILVRLPMNGDDKIRKEQAFTQEEKKTPIEPKSLVVKEQEEFPELEVEGIAANEGFKQGKTNEIEAEQGIFRANEPEVSAVSKKIGAENEFDEDSGEGEFGDVDAEQDEDGTQSAGAEALMHSDQVNMVLELFDGKII